MENELDINVTPLAEDIFYLLLSFDDKISAETGRKVFDRIKGKYSEMEYRSALDTAKKMVENLKTHGIPCAEWQ